MCGNSVGYGPFAICPVLAGIDTSLYEAAEIDCERMAADPHITLPSLLR